MCHVSPRPSSRVALPGDGRVSLCLIWVDLYGAFVKSIAEILKVQPTYSSRSVARIEGRLKKDKRLDAHFRGHDGGGTTDKKLAC